MAGAAKRPGASRRPSAAQKSLGSASAKNVVRRFVEEFQGAGRTEVADELLADDFVSHSTPPDMPPGREGIKALFGMLRQAFPDLGVEIHDMVAEGDEVVTRKTFRGTHEGYFFGLAPTGRPARLDAIDIIRVKHGRLVEHWSVIDLFGMLQQLAPAPA